MNVASRVFSAPLTRVFTLPSGHRLEFKADVFNVFNNVNQPELDFGGRRNPDGQGFAAFGRVVEGMDVVRKIYRSPNETAQQLTPPIRILKVTRTS